MSRYAKVWKNCISIYILSYCFKAVMTKAL